MTPAEARTGPAPRSARTGRSSRSECARCEASRKPASAPRRWRARRRLRSMAPRSTSQGRARRSFARARSQPIRSALSAASRSTRARRSSMRAAWMPGPEAAARRPERGPLRSPSVRGFSGRTRRRARRARPSAPGGVHSGGRPAVTDRFEACPRPGVPSRTALSLPCAAALSICLLALLGGSVLRPIGYAAAASLLAGPAMLAWSLCRRYELTRFDLVIRSGPFRRTIHLECIEGATGIGSGRAPAPPAGRPGRVFLLYGGRRGRRSVLLYPEDPELFLRRPRAPQPVPRAARRPPRAPQRAARDLVNGQRERGAPATSCGPSHPPSPCSTDRRPPRPRR